MNRFASSITNLRSSEIRDLMSLATAPDIISFAGGMPGNELFPLDTVDRIWQALSQKEKQTALQYGPTTGLPSLLESLSMYLEKKGLPVKNNRLIITTGSLQAIHILARAFLDPGDTVLVETPSFIGALSAFRACQATTVAVPLTSEGMDTTLLQQQLEILRPLPKFLYYTPNFHNPAGIVYSPTVKQEMARLLKGKDIPVIEDDAYSELYFHEEDLPSMRLMKAMDPDGIDICYTGSFSKILGPGLRLGWMLVPDEIYRKCELVKQSIDACSPSLSQVIADKFLRKGYINDYTAAMRHAYRQRGETMITVMKEWLPDYVSFTIPRGGFYIWLKLPEECDATVILKKAIEKGVVFVTGKTFDPDGVRNNALRVSFCNTDADTIRKGIPLLAEAIGELYGK